MNWTQRYAAQTRSEAVEQAKKLKALANDKSAGPGESSNANQFLQRLIERHSITPEELGESVSRPQTPPPGPSDFAKTINDVWSQVNQRRRP